MKFQQNKQLYHKLANAIRILTADAVEKAQSGHPGMPLGMAEIMTILAFDILKYNPKDPKWFNRDRLILSNGHGSLLLYAFYYLTGYKDFSLDDLKQFRKSHSKTPGHPEYGAYSAIETTTGPLGQGFSNSVGMAIAQKKYQQKYGAEFCDHKIYCIVGDGCLMEGISYEAASFAGHLALDNLVILFDDNNITIDGAASLACSEDQIAKFQALGWETQSIDGHNPEEIYHSLIKAQNATKPVFIACKTIIGKGCPTKQNSERVHGAPLGQEEVRVLKQNLSFPPEEFCIPKELLNLWQGASEYNIAKYNKWKSVANHTKIRSFEDDLSNITEMLKQLIINPTTQAQSTRVSAGIIIAELLEHSDKIICGSADLSMSNNIINELSQPITKDDFSGNFIHYGVREHAMTAIMSGLSLYGFLPIGGTFLIFSDYMKPAIRLAAMMKQKVIYILTHDSIGVGEDGPTHQPFEQLSSLRVIPNLLVMRPADYLETIYCFRLALEHQGPVAFTLTRQSVAQLSNLSDTVFASDQISSGAYIILDNEDIDITIFATGSEVKLALDVAKILDQKNIKIRLVSVPCLNLLLKQDKSYLDHLTGTPKLKVVIEAGSSFGWHKIIGKEGVFFGVEDFGISAPYQDVYQHFNLNAAAIAENLYQLLPSKAGSS